MNNQKIECPSSCMSFREVKKSEVWERLDYSEEENRDAMFFLHVQSFDCSERQQPSERQYVPYNKTLNFCSSCVENMSSSACRERS